MKKIIALALLAVLLLTACAPRQPEETFSDFTAEGDLLTLTRGNVTVTVNARSGMVTSVKNDTDSFVLDGILVDAGIGGELIFRQLGYKDMSSLATYELPVLYPRMKELPDYAVDAITATAEGFTVSLTCSSYHFLYNYSLLTDGLALSVTISTESAEKVAVNGVGFLVRGLDGFRQEDTTFEFPGSTPAGKLSYPSGSKYKATSSDYSAPAVVISDGVKTGSVLFVDEVEKWTAGSYLDENGRPCAAFLAAAEGWLSSGTPMEVGTLYLSLGSPERNAYQTISRFWTELGYHTPTDTASTGNLVAIYSGHPYGTMDTGYFNQLTLQEYAECMDAVADMGFDAVWLLPVFWHTGDNVYEPIDAGIVDNRYGGLEGAKTFVETAHSLGLSVLFDFVPHGPRPAYSFAREHDGWISKNMQGNNQIEWECVSFDYNNPEYAAYNRELAKYYAQEIGLDGARIDCSMGGLPNWSSPIGLRASAAGLQAGVNVVTALREGFLEGGANVLLLPENFHPSPAYASVTDVFYDMPLYRAIFNLNQKGLSDTEYVSALTQYLTAEHESSVAGQLKLRFLGNHDTVTWTFDAQRAQTLYGTEKAKALWKAIGWIDGVLYIYQGDEDPAAYRLAGENLEDFFRELIDIKREYLPNSYDTAYVSTGSPIFAFYRYTEDSARLVLVNLSSEPQSYTVSAGDSVLANIGEYQLSGGTVTLDGYAGVVIDTVYPG